MSEDINGNHVIQKILFTWPEKYNQFIFDAMIKHCQVIACHKHGCCVMQKCIDGATTEQRISLVNKIASLTMVFVRNAFGNYVVQYVLELKSMAAIRRIAADLVPNLLILGKEKFSSNVIEKCLEYNESDVRDSMVCRILDAESYYDFLTD